MEGLAPPVEVPEQQPVANRGGKVRDRDENVGAGAGGSPNPAPKKGRRTEGPTIDKQGEVGVRRSARAAGKKTK